MKRLFMKKQLIYILLLVAGWGVSSCKKELSIENAGTQSTANFTALVNGVQWSAVPTQEGATILQGMINITGISADSEEITMTITDTALGTYILTPRTASLAAYGNVDSSGVAVFSTSQGDSSQAGGEVTVTAIDRVAQTISGTFSFKVYRSSDDQQRTITSGVFNQIPYTASLPANDPGDTLTADIDNSAFTAESIQASSFGSQITIVGSLSNGNQSIALILPSFVTPGTYNMNPTGGTVTYMGIYDEIVNGNNSADPASSGTITILQNNTSASRLRGTFQFNTTDLPPHPSHSLTDGFFSVYYGQ